MSRKKEEIDEIEEAQEVDEKELKKEKRQEAIAKRKNAKKKDKIARWGGVILLGLIMFVGFLLWVAGEMKTENPPLNQNTITPFKTNSNSGSVIVR